MMSNKKLQVYSIFRSVAGEVNSDCQGVPMTFIRLAGCNLSCDYCDSSEAQNPGLGMFMSIDEIWKRVEEFKCGRIMITGGEPLIQTPAIISLFQVLHSYGYKLFVETNGTIFIPRLARTWVDSWIIDWKIFASYIPSYLTNMDKNALNAGSNDFLKFIVTSLNELPTIAKVYRKYKFHTKLKFALSFVHNKIDPKVLIDWLFEEGLTELILNVQIHKYLGLEEDTKGGELKRIGWVG